MLPSISSKSCFQSFHRRSNATFGEISVSRASQELPKIQFVFGIRQEALYLIRNAFPALPKPYAATYSLERLSRVQQKEIVEIPAKIAGRQWDNDLVEKLLDDISEYPAETAHLSIVLTTLWDQRDIDSDLVSYNRLSGVAGILKDYLWKSVESR